MGNLGLIFAQFPDPCTPVSTPEPEKTSDKSSDSSSEESNVDLVQPKATTKVHPLARPYSELGDGQVTEILSKHLEHFQMASMTSGMISQKSCDDIVLYKEAMEHCARLYRVVVSTSAYTSVLVFFSFLFSLEYLIFLPFLPSLLLLFHSLLFSYLLYSAFSLFSPSLLSLFSLFYPSIFI